MSRRPLGHFKHTKIDRQFGHGGWDSHKANQSTVGCFAIQRFLSSLFASLAFSPRFLQLHDAPFYPSVTETQVGICFKFIEVLLSTNAVSSNSIVFFENECMIHAFFCGEMIRIKPLSTWTCGTNCDQSCSLIKRKLFWLFIPETSSRTAVFLGLTLSASTCQWYPGRSMTWEIILLISIGDHKAFAMAI